MCQLYFTRRFIMCVLTPTDFFTTIIHPSLIQLTKDADEMMQRGWQPLGGPFVAPSGKFCQAFCKKYEEKPAPVVKKTKK